jgi:hypothetical protein
MLGHCERFEHIRRTLWSLAASVTARLIVILSSSLALQVAQVSQELKANVDKPAPAGPQEKTSLKVEAPATATKPHSEKEFAGQVLRPDGSPAKGLSILGYSRFGKLTPDVSLENGSFARATTDADGKFKLNVSSSGPAIFWILPVDLAGERHVVPEVTGSQGQLGRLTLKSGISQASARATDRRRTRLHARHRRPHA